MLLRTVFSVILLLNNSVLKAQITLNANGFGSTYEDINAVLAPNYNVIEVPDCAHTSFGRHIDEIYDSELGSYVFRFHAHVTPDNDRCINFDRQRTEIKTYDQSPDNLLATIGETIRYKWLFKLSDTHQSSPRFTHIHQIKSVGGPFSQMPMFTLTTRQTNSSGHILQLRYAPEDVQSTLAQVSIAPFLGEWIEATEVITFGNIGSYSLELKQASNQAILLSYLNPVMDTWQDGSTFARPKWGIYRSLEFPSFLQDEEVLFNAFSIEENPNLSITNDLNILQNSIYLSQNPASDEVFLINAKEVLYDAIDIYDTAGKRLMSVSKNRPQKIDISNLKHGLYFVVLVKNGLRIHTLKLLKN